MKLSNFFVAFLTVCLAALALTGCSLTSPSPQNQPTSETSSTNTQTTTSTEEEDPKPFLPMELIGEQNRYDTYFYYYRDPVTDVVYINLDGYRSDSIVPMLDPATNTPLTYTRYKELYDIKTTQEENE